jgi:hypothetical protein
MDIQDYLIARHENRRLWAAACGLGLMLAVALLAL